MHILTKSQLDAALGLLGWQDEQLRQASGYSKATISHFRRDDGEGNAKRQKTALVLRGALEAAGVRFTQRGVELRESAGRG